MTVTDNVIEVPVEVVGCPDGHAFCAGKDCDDGYHSGEFRWLSAQRFKSGEWVDTATTVSAYCDDEEESPTPTMIALIIDDFVGEARFTPAEARQLSANLAAVADEADPLPDGVTATSPEFLHIGDELLTADGWQTVRGVYRGGAPEPTVPGWDIPDELVTVFTDEMNIVSDGWQLDPENLVQIRRSRHGACTIQFIEPLPTGGTK